MMIPLHFTKFNERIKAMNSGSSKELKMTAVEARALHADIFAMLDELNSLKADLNEPQIITLDLDAGNDSL